VVSLMNALVICWGTTMVALAGLLIYRSLVAMKEEDLLFLDPAEWQLEREQEVILSKLRRLTPYVRGLAVVCVALLAVIVGILIYQIALSVPQLQCFRFGGAATDV
jgi:hypothetical protein